MVSVALLEVENLSMFYRGKRGLVRAVNDVSFSLDENECLGLVGESGCGKTSVGFALMRLLPPNAQIAAGAIRLGGADLTDMSEAELQKVRWTQMAMVFQAAMNALNPVLTVREQLVEAMLCHGSVPNQQAAVARAGELFELVGLPAARLGAYPHEFSGGMRQRVIIAMSLACQPKLLIADEPTTALDVVVQDQIFLKLAELRKRLGIGMILISHDIGVIAENCNQVAVMYGGKVVEYGPVERVFSAPAHPYTTLLLRSTPHIFGTGTSLLSLPGSPPDLTQPWVGCIFAHRCPAATDLCTQAAPPRKELPGGHSVSCHYAGELTPAELIASVPVFAKADTVPHATPLVEMRGVVKSYTANAGFLASLLGRTKAVKAVNGIDLTIRKGEAVGLVGESGCGKTTTGMLLSRLEELSAGTIAFDRQDVSGLSGARLKEFRRRVQVIFQDPYESLNPRMSIYEILEEPLVVHGVGAGAAERQQLVFRMMERVGLTPVAVAASKVPSQLSGGQRQRVAIARAMILKPDVVIADEPLSMLDASVKAGVMALMKDFKQDGVTFLVITHDLSIARYLCDRIAIMYLGDIVEIGATDNVIDHPKHPYTRVLLSSVPDPDVLRKRHRFLVDGEPPNPAARPSGCPFHPRCPEARSVCADWSAHLIQSGQQEVACLLYQGDSEDRAG
ncbi:MAG: transporter ATP-binding protein [Firmicutes bacterium]|nr:transporter ATP-binding protein [Bacillota bacterium]